MLLKDMEYAVMIAECGSFSKAAARLYVTQPALSQAVQRLEEELGVKLFRRDVSPLRPTPAGDIFLEDVHRALSIVHSLPKKMDDLRELKRGAINIGVSQTYVEVTLAPILPEFRKLYPGIEMHFVEGSGSELEELVLQNKLDFCIVSKPLTNSQLAFEDISQEEILLAVPNDHPLKKKAKLNPKTGFEEIDLRLFANEPFVLMNSSRARDMAVDICGKAGFTPNVALETKMMGTVNAFVASGLGVGFVSDAIIKRAMPENRATYYRMKDIAVARIFGAAYRGDNYLSTAAHAFIKFVQDKQK